MKQAKEIIRKRMEGGWDFAGYIPPETRGSGEVETMTLIFQREE